MSISTLSIHSATRSSILRIQGELRNAEKELSTLRHADVGRALGGDTAKAVSFRAQETSLDRQLQSNKTVTSRLELVDDGLATLTAGAESMMTTLLSGMRDTAAIDIAASQARISLEQMGGALNLSVAGQHLFGGANTGAQTFDETAGSAATAADFDAYLAGIGKTRSDVSASEMETYLAGSFDALFADPAWGAAWSDASDTAMTARISPNETVEASLTANETAFRRVAAAYSMVADLGIAGLNEAARGVLVTKATQTLKEGLDGVNAQRAEIGFRLGRIEAADAQLVQRKDIVSAAFGRLENLDPSEVALRVTQLETQLEATYTVTGRLQALNILNYL